MGKFGVYYPNEKNNMQETMRARGILYVPTQIIWVLRGTNRKLQYNMLDIRKFYHSLFPRWYDWYGIIDQYFGL